MKRAPEIVSAARALDHRHHLSPDSRRRAGPRVRRRPRLPRLAALLRIVDPSRVGGHELAAWIVTAHLLVAIVIVQLLLYATFEAFAPASHAPEAPQAPKAPWVIAALIVLTLVQAGFGTQVRSRIESIPDTEIVFDGALDESLWLDTLHRDLALAVLISSLLITLWM